MAKSFSYHFFLRLLKILEAQEDFFQAYKSMYNILYLFSKVKELVSERNYSKKYNNTFNSKVNTFRFSYALVSNSY